MKTITLYGKKAAGRVALVDDEDYELVGQFRWNVWEYPRRSGSLTGPYAHSRVSDQGNGKQRIFAMHTLVSGYERTDHINHYGLDNQRHNLRQVTGAQNMANARPRARGTSDFKGVYWNRLERKWRARINVAGTRTELGSFTSEVDAAHAYDVAAVEAFGVYAFPNFPENALQASEAARQAEWAAFTAQREAFQAAALAYVPVSRAEWWTRVTPDERTCTICGAAYLTRCSKRTFYCGPKCCRRAQTLRQRAAREVARDAAA